MDLRIDTLFGGELEPTHDSRNDLESLLLGPGSAEVPHREDAFLADFASWLGARGVAPDRRRAALELASDALDHVGDPDGTWQGLPVERWLGAGAARGGYTHARLELARELVSWLGERGRLSLHGQRSLARRIAALRTCAGRLAQRELGSDPQLAA